jgi:hypothetical protein
VKPAIDETMKMMDYGHYYDSRLDQNKQHMKKRKSSMITVVTSHVYLAAARLLFSRGDKNTPGYQGPSRIGKECDLVTESSDPNPFPRWGTGEPKGQYTIHQARFSQC